MKTKAIIDSIDLKILYVKEGKLVMEIVNQIGISHKNLKKHLDKLSNLGLISFELKKGSNRKPIKLTDNGKIIRKIFKMG
jgi:DNA-binding MarR family transcriptional regulator